MEKTERKEKESRSVPDSDALKSVRTRAHESRLSRCATETTRRTVAASATNTYITRAYVIVISLFINIIAVN